MPEDIVTVLSNLKTTMGRMGCRPQKANTDAATGYTINDPPDDFKGIWVGTLVNTKTDDIILAAFPYTREATRKLLDEGFGISTKPLWFQKKLLTERKIKQLAELSHKEKDEFLAQLIQKTYPLSEKCKEQQD